MPNHTILGKIEMDYSEKEGVYHNFVFNKMNDTFCFTYPCTMRDQLKGRCLKIQETKKR